MLTNKIRNFFCDIQFRLSDLFLAIGFIPMVLFLACGQIFMRYPNPNDVAISLPVIVVSFVILIMSWGFYICLEYKIGNKVNKFINIIFIIVAIIGLVGIAIQPSHIEIDFVSISGEQLSAEVDISTTHYVFFSLDILSIILFIYIGLFIFPKRFKSIKIIEVIGYLVLFTSFLLIIYSYIVEGKDYALLIDAVKKSDTLLIKLYSAKSFIINSNAYGMFLMMGILFCCFFHSLHKKWWLFLIAAFFFGNMLFSFCRASIILSVVVVFIYVLNLLINKTKAGTTGYVVFWLILIGVIALIATLIAIELFFGINIFHINILFEQHNSLNSREAIWENTYKLVSQSLPLSIFFGRGFGTLNEALLQMNLISVFNDQFAFPTHNGYLGLFAEGGLLFLLAYLALVFYICFIFVKCYKKEAPTTLALSFGIIVFSFYSLIETIHYLVYPFMAVLLIYYNVLKNQKD